MTARPALVRGRKSARSIPDDAASWDGVVPFHDCDPLGVVWHGHYHKYLEHGRTALLKRHRLDVPDFIELGFKLYVTESRCRYAYPLHYDDAYRVHAWFIDFEQRLHIGYQIVNITENRTSARAWTVLATTDEAGNMLWETPREIVARIAG